MATSSMSRTIGPEGATYEIQDVNGVATVLADGVAIAQIVQQAAVTDAGAITAFTPTASGAVTVTSNAATDLDTTQAALDTLVDEVMALRTTVNTIITRLETAGVIVTS